MKLEMHNINLSPEVRILADGQIGYFYSIHQLEELKYRKLIAATYEEMKELTHNPMSTPIQQLA